MSNLLSLDAVRPNFRRLAKRTAHKSLGRFTFRSLRTSLVARTAPNASQSTVNASEIAFFSRLSEKWWDERGEFMFLHKMNPVRMQFIRDKMLEVARDEKGEEFAADLEGRNAVLQGVDVVDVGCGGGLLCESLARMGANTVGIDASSSNIAIASLHASADPQLSLDSFPSSSTKRRPGSLEYRHTSAEDLALEPKRYDAVFSMEVLEHVDNPPAFLRACSELLKPGGHLFLSTMARTPLSFFVNIIAPEYILGQVSPGTHTHSKFVNPSELIEFFQRHKSSHDGKQGVPWITRTYEHGMPSRTEAEVRGLIFVPWKGRWELAPRAANAFGLATQCNYMFWARKPREM